jgi:hypothetical protein
LQVVAPGQPVAPRRRLTTYLPALLIIGALLTVVVGQTLLTNGQVRMASVQQQLTTEQGVHRQALLQVTQLETPSRIVGAATGQLHMVHPTHVLQLPYVPLDTPLATPTVSPVPVPPAAPSTQTAAQ